jgi:hypothetical protein
VASRPGGLNISEWLQSRNHGSARKSLSGYLRVADPLSPEGKAEAVGEAMGKGTQRTAGIWAQASREGLTEITSGRAIFQQRWRCPAKTPGRGDTPKARGGRWLGAWARLSEDGGVTPFDAMPDIAPPEVTPEVGKGALGTGRRWYRSSARALTRGTTVTFEPARGHEQTGGKRGVRARQRLSFAAAGKVRGGQPRSEPDSGQPTVRDRRGGLGKRDQGGNVNPPRNRKSGAGNPPPTVRALEFYPNKPAARYFRGGAGNVTRRAGLRPTAKAVDWPPDATVGAPALYPTGKHIRGMRR